MDLRNVDIHLNMVLVSKRWGQEESYGCALNATSNNPGALIWQIDLGMGDKEIGIVLTVLDLGNLGNKEVQIVLKKLKNQIRAIIHGANGIIRMAIGVSPGDIQKAQILQAIWNFQQYVVAIRIVK